jgi:hypothetical protein
VIRWLQVELNPLKHCWLATARAWFALRAPQLDPLTPLGGFATYIEPHWIVGVDWRVELKPLDWLMQFVEH